MHGQQWEPALCGRQNKSKVENKKRGQEGWVSGLLEKTARKVQTVTLSSGKANDSYVRERSP